MPKNKLWIIIAVLLIAIAGLVYWLSPNQQQQSTNAQNQNIQFDAQGNPIHTDSANSNSSNPFASKSQQDIEINCQMDIDAGNNLVVNELTRNCYEFFITQIGEKELDQIRKDFETYIQSGYKDPAASQIVDLWKRYLDYRDKMGDIPKPNFSDEDPRYYRTIFDSTQNLRKQFFSNHEIEGLFGNEDTYHRYTLDRLDVMANKNLSEEEKAKKLKDLFNDLPEDWKANLEQINKVEDLRKLTAEIKARGGSAEEIRQMRLELVGPEATQRLENLDVQRSDWKNRVNSYLTERDQIMKSGMSDSAKEKSVQQLRNQHFAKKEEQLRIQTFETVHDRGGEQPFAD